MSATLQAKRPAVKRHVAKCYEAFTGGNDRIDRTAKLIKGVKILGLQSRNSGRTIGLDTDEPYSYDPSAVASAVRLYEGKAVNLNHPAFRYDSRGQRHAASQTSVFDRYGILRNVRAGHDGMYADIEYLDSHPMTPRVLESIERSMNLFALSHNAVTRPELRNGRPVIVEIVDVESVDLIGERPGTTTSLFESEYPMDPEKDDTATTTEADVPTDAPPEESGGVDAAIKALQNAVLDDPNIDSAKAIKAIEGLLEKLKGMSPASKESTTEAAEEGDEEKPAEDEKKVAAESAALKAHQAAVATLESRKLTVTSERIGILAKTPADVQPSLVQAWETADKAGRVKPSSGNRQQPQNVDRKAEDFRAMAFSN